MTKNTWSNPPAQWTLIPQIDPKTNYPTNANPRDIVHQGYADLIQKVTVAMEFKRDLVFQTQARAAKAPDVVKLQTAKSAVDLAVAWANSFITDLNEYSKASGGANKDDNDTDETLAKVAKISFEDFQTVANFIAYANAYSLEDAETSAGFE